MEHKQSDGEKVYAQFDEDPSDSGPEPRPNHGTGHGLRVVVVNRDRSTTSGLTPRGPEAVLVDDPVLMGGGGSGSWSCFARPQTACCTAPR